MVSREFSSDAIVVFDEAHNIDNICIESLTVELPMTALQEASQSLASLMNGVLRTKGRSAERLEQEYRRLMEDIAAVRASNQGASTDLAPSPILNLTDSDINAVIPEEIRKAEDFIAQLQAIVRYLKVKIRRTEGTIQEPHTRFLRDLGSDVGIGDLRWLRFSSDRLASLLRTLQVADWTTFRSLHKLTDLLSIGASFHQGFAVLIETLDDFTGELRPRLIFACLDASIAIRPVFEKFRNVVLTSGTLSPLDTYPNILSFRASIASSFNMTLDRPCVCPLIVTRGFDQQTFSSKFNERSNDGIIRNYGDLLVRFIAHVPDGVVAFFPSYLYMEEVLGRWAEWNILERLQVYKLLFIESQDSIEASMAIRNYRDACDSGRGALLLSVARGRAAEGIDLDHHYGRAVVLFGVPFQYTESRVLRARLEYLREAHQIAEDEFLIFDAMRQAAQCVGRVIRNKQDYGIMLLVDKRYQRIRLRSKLPQWITQFLLDPYLDLDPQSAIVIARKFLLLNART
uniref:DNA 5'-3' helicase n=1 Tax=Compsopogon caeruleus TaxID=31354 RepID=A0A7S1TH09_9RHOD|mmetsp:Transcript_7153/g.14716  ORF Transcript_7153/g.14716 Transcript_7153/m.14716 type:complete len:514 (+) Transcript_7153:848-2389(+)